MDAMDILGSLLGGKAQSNTPGGSILKDILGGIAGKQSAPPRRAPEPPAQNRPRTIGDAARSLEDLLGVSNEHHQQRQQAPTQAPPSLTPEGESMNEQAEVLVRAMVNAAKADGQVDQAQQEAILKRLEHVSLKEIDFLRPEFAKKTDVREFAWSVPLGLEEQVYTISLLAIDLDENKEATYLGDLAHGLRLAPKRCNEIHQKYGAPVIFQA